MGTETETETGTGTVSRQLVFELERHLRSTKENISLQESNVIMELKAKAFRGFTIGLTGGSVVAWLATWKLHHVLRLGITAATGFSAGLGTYSMSLRSGADYILSLEGTRMQKELQALMLKRYQNVPSVMQRASKHFYSEEVYDDTSDKPRLRWRFRNTFGETAADSVEHNEQDSYVVKSNEGRTVPKKTNPKQNQTFTTAADKAENPFDCIFGSSANEELPSSDPSDASHKKHGRTHKRSHRRHRRRHAEDSDA